MRRLVLFALLAACSGGVLAQSAVHKCLARIDGRAVAESGDANAHTARLEGALWPPVVAQDSKALGLYERMRYYSVPGVSVAVIHDGKVDWVRGWGASDASRCTPVTPLTRFQAASISKPVSAILALRMVEQGRIDLDADINRYLQGWQLPKPAGIEPGYATLRQILSHTAGLTVHGFPGYAQGAARPSVVQVLDGSPPANSPAVRIEFAPGSRFQYSGGGYVIAQLALQQVGGKPYAQLEAEQVLQPLGLARSGFDQPPAADDAGPIASAHVQGNVVEGGFHVYPELAAAGLWTTPGDLARVLIDVQAAYAGETGHRLSPAMARTMLTPGLQAMGLGFVVKGEGAALRFGHDGVNEGFESSMVAYAGKGEGVVVMTNGQGGRQLADEIIRGVAADYGWSELAPRRVAAVAVARKRLATYVGAYAAPGIDVVIEQGEGGLTARVGGAVAERLYALAPNRFIAQSSAAVIEFEGDGEAPSTGFRILEGGPPVTVARTTARSAQIGATPIFLRGSMNDWSLAAPVAATAPQVYAVVLELEAGDYEFKLASEDWSTVDLGVAGAASDLHGDSGPITLVQRGSNIRLSLKDPGRYRFVIDDSKAGGPLLDIRRLP